MQIVIDITVELYEANIRGLEAREVWDLREAVENGTPLPKGHGDLIDRSEVIKSLFDYHKGKKTIGQCIEDVQTIIAAESEVAEI